MGSRIPIFGLPHKLNVYRNAEADDGYGGITVTHVILCNDLRSRITLMSNKDELEVFGEATGEHWKIVSHYLEALQRSDKIKVSANSKPTPLDSTKYYNVVWHKPQIDDHGKFHHHSMIVELKKEDNE